MTYTEALTQLDELLTAERQALVDVKLDVVVALGGRKSELLQVIEDGLEAPDGADEDTVALARKVREAAERNFFLVRHLRGCLTVVGGDSGATGTYGRDGSAWPAGHAGLLHAKL